MFLYSGIGVNTLAYGHHRITRHVNDVDVIERSGEDMVLSAEEAARDLIRPGRPWPHLFPLGEEPVAATRAANAARAADARLRMRAVVAQLQNGQRPTSDTLNSPLVNALVDSVLDETFRGAIDHDFDPDDVEALHEVAVSFRDSGVDTDELKRRLLLLVGSLREMMLEEDGEPDGEVDVDEDE